MSPRRPRVGVLGAVALGLVLLGALVGFARLPDADPASPGPASSSGGDRSAGDGAPARPNASARTPRERIFDDGRFLVAFYGTAGTGALGVLGETPPDVAFARLAREAARFERPRQPVLPVFELIVTIADPFPGPDGDYAHDLPRAAVQRYIDAARRHGALLVLDLQPGRTDFTTAAKRWAWALRDPYVGLALDPEWRMARGEVPGQVIGSVDAAEINRTTAWLADLQQRHRLPQKLLVLHQFRTDMITRIGSVQPRRSLAMVQHVDGFGTPGQKLDTFAAVAQPQRFRMGFKLFYDEDVDLMDPTAVHRIRPKVRFVSFQ
ncbi:hypothetical protein [Nocardioides sp.]|uniref:hypothetical protein n=1 Tax=Nocardioides sp. TaxID=35761 RepID=UPI0035197241